MQDYISRNGYYIREIRTEGTSTELRIEFERVTWEINKSDLRGSRKQLIKIAETFFKNRIIRALQDCIVLEKYHNRYSVISKEVPGRPYQTVYDENGYLTSHKKRRRKRKKGNRNGSR